MPVLPPPCVKPLDLYRPRDPQASDLWRLMDRHFETFRCVYDERFQAKYGYWRPIVERSVRAYLRCGDLHEGFARVRCGDCVHVRRQLARPRERRLERPWKVSASHVSLRVSDD